MLSNQTIVNTPSAATAHDRPDASLLDASLLDASLLDASLLDASLLDAIVSDNHLHADWLNTLSFLEHCGARKIHRTDFGPYLDETILTHAAEEARHALFYKKLVRRIDATATAGFDFKRMLCGYAGYRYFQSLDSSIEAVVKSSAEASARSADTSTNTFPAHSPSGLRSDAALASADRPKRNLLCYLYVTTLIEERAMKVFPAYNEACLRAGLSLRIDGIIREEEGHLEEMKQMLPLHDVGWQSRLEEMRRIEHRLFSAFSAALRRRVAAYRS